MKRIGNKVILAIMVYEIFLKSCVRSGHIFYNLAIIIEGRSRITTNPEKTK